MRNTARALKAMITIGLAMVVIAPAAHANILDAIVVAHRGATTSTTAEGTMPAYQYAVRHRADYLDGDIQWAKDGADADTVGAIVITHDSTLNRVTNCSGYVSDWLWSSIYDKCRTDVGKQRLIRVVDLLKYGNSVGKKFTLELKPTSITNAQAKQLWNQLKNSPVQLEAGTGRLSALNKVKNLDAADPYHKISYARVTSGGGGWPSVSELKQTSNNRPRHMSIPATVMSTYKAGGLKVFLYTAKNESDYEKMAKLGPYGVVVDDVGRFQRWRDAQG